MIINMDELEQLKLEINEYYEDKTQLDSFKKLVDENGSRIKNRMKEFNISEIQTDEGYKAKLTIQKRESLDEEGLIAKLKELDLNSAIKTKEYIDMDELENLIYNEELDAAELTPFKQIKEIPTLKVTERK